MSGQNTTRMGIIVAEVAFILCTAVSAGFSSELKIDLVSPGKTQVAELKTLLGKPMSIVREGASREYHFYGLGQGSTMDATVAVTKGVVDYVSYLCTDSMKQIKAKYASEPAVTQSVSANQSGYKKTLTQVVYEAQGRGYLYDPKTSKIKACLAFRPGQKFDELGR